MFERWEKRAGTTWRGGGGPQKAIELAPRDPLAYTRLGEVRTAQKKYKEAEALFDQALGMNPAFTEASGRAFAGLWQGEKAESAVYQPYPGSDYAGA